MFQFLRKLSHPKMPDQGWINSNTPDKLQRERTPDLLELESSPHKLIFVYDETMLNRGQSNLMSGGERLARAFTQEKYSAWNHKAGEHSRCILLDKSFTSVPRLRMKGELWQVPGKQFVELDKYYNNKIEYTRIRTKIVVPYRHLVHTKHISNIITDEKQAIVRAYAYIGILPYWEPLLDGGYLFSPVLSFTPNSNNGRVRTGDYYCWTFAEVKNEQ